MGGLRLSTGKLLPETCAEQTPEGCEVDLWVPGLTERTEPFRRAHLAGVEEPGRSEAYTNEERKVCFNERRAKEALPRERDQLSLAGKDQISREGEGGALPYTPVCQSYLLQAAPAVEPTSRSFPASAYRPRVLNPLPSPPTLPETPALSTDQEHPRRRRCG